MMLDLSQYPLVRVLERNTSVLKPERQIELLLDRNERFVIMMTRPSEQNNDDTPENRKSRSQFFKANKVRLRKFCAAAILIEGDKPVSKPVRAMAWALSKAFGVPFHFVPDEITALELAARYVNFEEPAASVLECAKKG